MSKKKKKKIPWWNFFLISEPEVKATISGVVNTGLGSCFDRVCHYKVFEVPIQAHSGTGALWEVTKERRLN